MVKNNNLIKLFSCFFFFIGMMFLFSLIPFTSRDTKYYDSNNTKIKLYDGIQIYESMNFEYDSINSFNFAINIDSNTNSKEQLILTKDEQTKFPEMKIDSYKKIIRIEISNGSITYKKDLYVEHFKEKNNNILIYTPKFKNVDFEDIYIYITCINIETSDNIYLYTNNSKNYSDFFTINGIESKGEIATTISVRQKNIALLTMFMILSVFLYLYIINKKKLIENITINNKFIFYLIELIFSIVFAITLVKFYTIFGSYEIISYKNLLPLFFSMLTIATIVFYGIKKYLQDCPTLFVILSIIIGIMYTFVIVPNGVPDERDHYYVAYKFADIGFNSETNILIPENFEVCGPRKGQSNYKCLNEIFNNIKYSDATYSVYSTAESYSDVLYIVPAIGIKASQLLNFSLSAGYYMARILNLLLTIFLGYVSIKILPKGKLILLVFLLNPMYIQQGMSVSADVLTNGLSILFISYIMSLHSKDKTTFIDKLFLFTMSIGLLIIKKPYFILLPLLLTLSKKEIKIRNKKCVLITLFTIALFYLILSNLNYTIYNKYTIFSLLRNPLDYIYILYSTLKVDGVYFFELMFGKKLASLQINIYSIYIYLYVFILFIACIIDKVKLNKKQIILFLITAFLIINIIFIGFLTIYSDVTMKINEISGIQGRYFIPVLILVLYVLSSIFNKVNIKFDLIKSAKWFSVILLIIHILIIIQCIQYYM